MVDERRGMAEICNLPAPKGTIDPESDAVPVTFDQQRDLLPTIRKCQKGIDVAESGGEEQATSAHSGTPDVFISYPLPESAVAETRQ